jgi:DNA-binding response OmpR family regulator
MTTAPRKIVLIADDDPNLRLLVSVTIQSGAYIVLEAADGDEAWSAILQHHPDLVLLDIQMPVRSGLDVLLAIRGDARLADTRVILLTAKAQRSDVEAGLGAGADLYLTKPFSPVDLLDRIAQALHRPPWQE